MGGAMWNWGEQVSSPVTQASWARPEAVRILRGASRFCDAGFHCEAIHALGFSQFLSLSLILLPCDWCWTTLQCYVIGHHRYIWKMCFHMLYGKVINMYYNHGLSWTDANIYILTCGISMITMWGRKPINQHNYCYEF